MDITELKNIKEKAEKGQRILNQINDKKRVLEEYQKAEKNASGFSFVLKSSQFGEVYFPHITETDKKIIIRNQILNLKNIIRNLEREFEAL